MSAKNCRPSGDATLHHLDEPQPEGPVIGSYAGAAIAATVVDLKGRRYRFAGVMPRRAEGCYDLGALAEGEWIVEPGLIYRWDGTEESKAAPALEQPWSQLI
ncbi:MAG: hypothetical protein U1E53_12395 [Dongiaceae bacterium]